MLLIATPVVGASLFLWVPLAAQMGQSSHPGSITLSATHPTSVGVMVPGIITPGLSISPVAGSTGRLTLTSTWNVDPAQPVTVTLAAFVEEPSASLETALAGAASGGSQVLASIGGPESSAPATREQPKRGRQVRPLFTQAIAPLVGRGGHTDDIRVRAGGTLTVIAITQ